MSRMCLAGVPFRDRDGELGAFDPVAVADGFALVVLLR